MFVVNIAKRTHFRGLFISYDNRTQWSTIQGVIGRVLISKVILNQSAERVARAQFEITGLILMNNRKLKELLPINSVKNTTRESLDYGVRAKIVLRNIYQSINEFLFYQVKAQNVGETIRIWSSKYMAFSKYSFLKLNASN